MLQSAGDKARYHLVMAEARYKSGIDDTTINHVSPAVTYYKDHSSRHDAARAYFYSALVKNNRHEYPSAVIDLLRAEKIAKADPDTMRVALIYRTIGDVFTLMNSWENGLSYHTKAQKCFENAKADNYSNYAYLDMARCYLPLDNYPTAIKYALIAFTYGKKTKDVSLMRCSLRVIAFSYWYLKEYEKAYNVYKEILDLGEDSLVEQDYYRLGLLYLHFGNIDMARKMEKKLDSINPNPDTKVLYTNIMLHDKNYPEAIKGFNHSIDKQNKALNESWSNNMATEIIRFEQNEERIILEAHRKERLLWGCIISLLVVILLLSISIVIRRNRRLTIDRDEDMQAIKRLNDTVSELTIGKDKSHREFASEIKNLKTSISESQAIIRDLMASRFTEFSELCQIYFQHDGQKDSQIKIYNEVRGLISKISSDNKFIKNIETKINDALNDIMKNFRKDFPSLNNWEYPLFMYNVCGIEPKIIALFLGVKPELIHKRKANLKRKIADSDSPLKEEYLSFLS